MRKRRNEWSFRLLHHQRLTESSFFLTLTYDPSNLVYSPNGLPTLHYPDVQKFLKRLREYQQRKLNYNEKISYYCVGEYGSKGLRPHYHLIIFNMHLSLAQRKSDIQALWKKGFIDVGSVTDASINYCTGYIMQGAWNKIADNDDRVPHRSWTSKGLGLGYLTPKMEEYLHDTLENRVRHPVKGFYMPLPRYYQKQVWTDEEKKILKWWNEQLAEIDFSKWTDADSQIKIDYHQTKQLSYDKSRKTTL